ncbi:MAG: CinA family protein [Clostridia bacterium]|nr:CinA family protein [Clostridia bacterium]
MTKELYLISRTCLEKMRQRGKRVSFAESCTGGLIAKAMTDHSGASDVFECGVVSYSGRIKSKILNVPCDIIATYGEVSEQVAKAMAQGIREISGADFGVGVTGIAGPTGGTVDKKVGLIYVAISSLTHTESYKLELYDKQLTREQRRKYTACFVYQKLIELLN